MLSLSLGCEEDGFLRLIIRFLPSKYAKRTLISLWQGRSRPPPWWNSSQETGQRGLGNGGGQGAEVRLPDNVNEGLSFLFSFLYAEPSLPPATPGHCGAQNFPDKVNEWNKTQPPKPLSSVLSYNLWLLSLFLPTSHLIFHWQLRKMATVSS